MVMHHPTTDVLVEYSAGVLPIAPSACVSGHLNYCPQCREIVAQQQSAAAALMTALQPTAVSESVLDAVLARLDEPAPLSFAEGRAANSEGVLPGLLERIINGDFSELIWRKVTKSLSVSYLKTGDSDNEFALYRIAAGGKIPEHRHGGHEMTLVLQGGFSDESGTYAPGDFVLKDGDDHHSPIADADGDCICLAVLDAPLQFTRWQYRWLNPFMSLRAG